MVTTHIEIEDRYDEDTDTVFEVEVNWEFSPYDPGVCSGPVEVCYPPEGGETLKCEVILPDGTKIADGESWLREELGERGYEAAEEQAFVDDEEDDGCR